MILISTSSNINSENNINGSFILIDKNIDDNGILTTSICFDPSKHKELYYTILNCNFWYIKNSYDSIGIIINFYDLFSGKIQINPEKCIQNVNINTCLEYCPEFTITFNFEQNIKKAGLFYLEISDINSPCECDNINLAYRLLRDSTTDVQFPLTLNNVIKVGMVLVYNIGSDIYVYPLPKLTCNETFDIPPPKSKILPENSKAFDFFSRKSQIDLNSIINSIDNIPQVNQNIQQIIYRK